MKQRERFRGWRKGGRAAPRCLLRWRRPRGKVARRRAPGPRSEPRGAPASLRRLPTPSPARRSTASRPRCLRCGGWGRRGTRLGGGGSELCGATWCRGPSGVVVGVGVGGVGGTGTRLVCEGGKACSWLYNPCTHKSKNFKLYDIDIAYIFCNSVIYEGPDKYHACFMSGSSRAGFKTSLLVSLKESPEACGCLRPPLFLVAELSCAQAVAQFIS